MRQLNKTNFLFCLILCLSFLQNTQAQLHFEDFIYEGIGQPQLDRVNGVAASPDGRHVYAISEDDNAITVFARSQTTGRLTHSESFRNGQNNIQGMLGVYDVLISPDGKHVYVCGYQDGTIVALERDNASGTLSYLFHLQDNQGDTDALSGILYMDMSPDGNHLYAVSPDENAISIFSRDVLTGDLTLVNKAQDGINGVENFQYPIYPVVSPNGKNVYVSSYDDSSIVVFSRNNTTGDLTYTGSFSNNSNGLSDMDGPWGLCVSPDNANLYVTGNSESSLVVFDCNPSNGSLTFSESFVDDQGGVDGLSGAVVVKTNGTGDQVYVLGPFDSSIAIFDRNTNGTLNFSGTLTDGVGSNQGLAYPLDFVISEDDENAYVAGYDDDALVVLERNTTSGLLFFSEMEQADINGVAGLNGAKATAITDDGEFLYLVSENDDALVSFSRNPETGALDFIQLLRDGQDGVDGLNGATQVLVTEDGRHVYVAAYWDQAVSLFRRNPSTGELTYVTKYSDGQNGINGIRGANSVKISPDGNSIYVTGYFDNGIAVFDRNITNGELTFVEAEIDGFNGADGLVWATSCEVSPNGRYVFVTSQFENSVAVYDRNTSDGSLNFNAVYRDSPSMNGLSAATDVVITEDEKFVYVSGRNDQAIAMFDFNNMTGQLSYLGFVQSGIDDVSGLNGISDLHISPSGTQLYAAGSFDNSIVVFQINLASGQLVFERAQKDDQENVNGIGNPKGITCSPDNRFIYCTGFDDDALGIFSCTYLLDMEETICSSDSVVVGTSIYKSNGIFQDTFEFGGCRTVTTLDLTVYPNSTSFSKEICNGETYVFNGENITSSGTYTETFTSSLGCDSVVQLTLQVVNSHSPGTEDVTICAGENYAFGNEMLSSSGTYEHTYTSTGGCDSTVSLNLTVIDDAPTVLEVSICEGEFYVFGNQNFVTSGNYSKTFMSSEGCDSIVNLQLVVVDPNEVSEVNASICDGEEYVLDGVSYTQTGSYQQTVTTTSGCQSDIILNLTVVGTGSSSVTDYFCEGTAYPFGTQVLTQEGTYEDTFESSAGCDSTVTLTLIEIPRQVVIDEEICGGQSYLFNGQDITAAGTYQTTLTSTMGCGDSLVILNLSITPDQATEEVTICDGDSYQLGTQTLTEEGTYTEMIFTPNGCEQELTVVLTLQGAQELESELIVCFGETYEFGAQTLSSSGIYTETLNTVHGCDSTVRLLFTVNAEIQIGGVVSNSTDGSNGSIDLTVTGGGGLSYEYEWSNGEMTQDINGLSPGEYSVTVTDNNECQNELSFTVDGVTSTDADLEEIYEFKVAPNPVAPDGSLSVNIHSTKAMDAHLMIYNQSGTRVLEKRGVGVKNGEQTVLLDAPHASGIYIIILFDEEGNRVIERIVVQ